VIKVPGRIRTRIPSPVLAASLLSPGETALQEKAIPMQAVGNGFPVIVHEPRFLKISKNQPERITINQRKSQGWCGKAYPFKAATRKHPGGEQSFPAPVKGFSTFLRHRLTKRGKESIMVFLKFTLRIRNF
jgi:hypothetical protein